MKITRFTIIGTSKVFIPLPILVKGMKTLDVPIIVNEQYKKGIGETIEPLKELVNEYEAYEKTTFSGCQNSDILNAFKKSGKKILLLLE